MWKTADLINILVLAIGALKISLDRVFGKYNADTIPENIIPVHFELVKLKLLIVRILVKMGHDLHFPVLLITLSRTLQS